MQVDTPGLQHFIHGPGIAFNLAAGFFIADCDEWTVSLYPRGFFYMKANDFESKEQLPEMLRFVLNPTNP